MRLPNDQDEKSVVQMPQEGQRRMKVGDKVKIIGGRYAGREGVIAEISARGSQAEHPYILSLYKDEVIDFQVGCTASQLEIKQDNKETN